MLQQRWSEVSEKYSDVVDPAIKYGGGPAEARALLDEVSMLVTVVELQERELLAPDDESVSAVGEHVRIRVQLVETLEQVEANRLVLVQAMQRLVTMLETGERGMIFLIEYDRERGELRSLRSFDASERLKAEDSRLALELLLNGQRLRREVVLLEAANEGAIRRTHRRYFERIEDLATIQKSNGR